ncbi:hypothetical protein [Falsiroseomonas oryziterrae]|uniref:hypothetical protein n=1 Tax=Falsiroseomonas oryziterrae TaxID=2911368 RepID=UPI001F1AA7DA|nr:hypothetical protein [Roseomonas sp. NPKOSM-4]
MRLRAAVLGVLLLGSLAPAVAEEVTLRANRPGRGAMELRVEPAQAAWIIRVLDPAGAQVQVIEVRRDATQPPPHIVDADGDNAGDLWVPIAVDNANTTFEIWRNVPVAGRFVRAGTVSGISFRRDGGYLVAIGRDGCCALGYEFHRFRPDGLLFLTFTISASFRADGTVEDCGVTVETDRAPEALRRRWCAGGAEDQRPGLRL